MDRISQAEGAINGKGKLWFTDGDPSPTGHAPSRITARFLNIVMEELANLVEMSGQTLDPEINNQVLKAVQILSKLKDFSGDDSIKPKSISGNKLRDQTITGHKVENHTLSREKLLEEDQYIEASTNGNITIRTPSGSKPIPARFNIQIYRNMFGMQMDGTITPEEYSVNEDEIELSYGLVSFDLPDSIGTIFEVRNTGSASILLESSRSRGSCMKSIIGFKNDRLTYQFNLNGFVGPNISSINRVEFSHSIPLIDKFLLPDIVQ